MRRWWGQFNYTHRGVNFVIEKCVSEDACLGRNKFVINVDGVDITVHCCRNDLCNGSDNLLQNEIENKV